MRLRRAKRHSRPTRVAGMASRAGPGTRIIVPAGHENNELGAIVERFNATLDQLNNTIVSLTTGAELSLIINETPPVVWNTEEAHSAIYDAECTAELFCNIVHRWQDLGGWCPAESAGRRAGEPVFSGDSVD